MENSQALLLALLAKVSWQLQGNNIDYAPVLKKGHVQTPLKAWNARDELHKMCPSLNLTEIKLLEIAASQLTGAIFVPAKLFMTTPQAVELVNQPPCCFFVQDNFEQVIKHW